MLAEQIDDVPGELAGAIDLGGARRDPLASEVAHRLADHHLLFVETNVHARDAIKPAWSGHPRNTWRAMTTRWI